MSLDLSRLAASGLAALTVSCSAHAATETVTGAFVFSAVVTNTTVTDPFFLDPFSGDPAGLVSATLSIDSRILVNDLTAAEAFASVLLNGTPLASMALGQSENFLTFSADLRARGRRILLRRCPGRFRPRAVRGRRRVHRALACRHRGAVSGTAGLRHRLSDL